MPICKTKEVEENTLALEQCLALFLPLSNSHFCDTSSFMHLRLSH